MELLEKGAERGNAVGDGYNEAGFRNRQAVYKSYGVPEMTNQQAFAAVLDLLNRVPRPPDAQPCIAATVEQVNSLETTLGYRLPELVRTWFMTCNGVIAGPGGLYGTTTGIDFLSIESVLVMYPDWRGRKWLPIAGDGTGNQYVIDTSRSHLGMDGVFFVVVSEDPQELAYVLASQLPRFLVFLLEREIGTRGWPFDRDYVLERDPDIGSVDPLSLLPWNA